MAKQVKKICLITPGHIASNPRLVKEAMALTEAGYLVHIIFTQYVDYLVAEDLAILRKNAKCSFSTLVWTKAHFTRRLFSGLYQKIAMRIANKIKQVNIWTKIAINRNYQWQYKEAVKIKADLYIAHNAGALAVAADAAEKNGAKFAFDAEDFHRGEDLASMVKHCLRLLEDNFLPTATYITAASPLIANEYEQLYQKPVTTILNVFPRPQLNFKENLDTVGLKLFWFSQTIGFGRGIEHVIKAMGMINDPSITLHLLGVHDEDVKVSFQDLALSYGLSISQLQFYPLIPPDQIFEFAAQFDIGMATETGIPYNRDICLTNKIFTYLTAGLAIVASETTSQKNFIKENSSVGKSYPIENIQILSEIINVYDKNRDLLQQTKLNAHHLAKEKLNWENESKIFIQIIEKSINS